MCGVAGVCRNWSAVRGRSAASSMIGAIAHRGPDGQAIEAISPAAGRTNLVLAHARLSILDLSAAAAQPMCHDATNSWLVYNGELYNHRELREELLRRGHRFRSTGDTEVLL